MSLSMGVVTCSSFPNDPALGKEKVRISHWRELNDLGILLYLMALLIELIGKTISPLLLLLLFPPGPKGGGEGTTRLLFEGKWKGEESTHSCLCFPWPWHQQCGGHLVLPPPQTQQTSWYFWDAFCSPRFRNSTQEKITQKECNGAEFKGSSASPHPQFLKLGLHPGSLHA